MSIINKEKDGSKFYVPVKWLENFDQNEMIDYLIKSDKDHISKEEFKKNFDGEELGDFVEEKRTLRSFEVIEERIKIVDFLKDLCKKYNIKNETFYRSVSLLDKYLSKTKIKFSCGEEILPFAIVCLSLAAKYEEINCNYLKFFKEKFLNDFEIKDLYKKELEVLKTLNFRLGVSNFYTFNNILIQVALTNTKNISNELNACFNLEEDKDNICQMLLQHNEFITKKFVSCKECMFSRPLNIGIICFKMTLLSMKLNGYKNALLINKLVDLDILSKALSQEFLDKCDIASSNFFNYLFLQSLRENQNKTPRTTDHKGFE